MNNIDKAYTASNSVGEFALKYFEYLYKVLKSVDPEQINKLGELLLQKRKEKRKIFVVGNGGSAATAITMSNDLGFDIIKKTGSDTPFRVHCLVYNNSVMTGIGNDLGYENIFLEQLKIHYSPGDLLIAISASGNSSNILKAAQFVKSRDGTLVGFLGFSGGKLLKLCDVKIHFKTEKGEYGPVEDSHLIINHILAHWFQNKLK